MSGISPGECEDLVLAVVRGGELVRYDMIGTFGIGATPLFIPVEAVERVTDDDVGVDRSQAQVAEAPQYAPI